DAPVSGDAGQGVACGSTRCPMGRVCCNASCGICTLPDVACIQTVCGPDAGTAGAPCTADGDCRLFDNYCGGCACDALGKNDPDPKCSGPLVACVRQPCMGKVAACLKGRCAVADSSSALQWYPTCGDPVCHGWTPKTDVPLCTT